MTKHIFAHERKHPSGQEDNDFQVFIETEDDTKFPQPDGAHEYFYLGEEGDMPNGFNRLAHIYKADYQHNDIELGKRASNEFIITPTEKPANISSRPLTNTQDETGAIVQIPVKEASIAVKPLTDEEVGRRISTACRTIFAKLGALSHYEFIGNTPANRKKVGAQVYEATHLQVKYIALLAMAIHRNYFLKWTHSDTEVGDTRALIGYLEGYYQDIEAVMARNLKLPQKNIADLLAAAPANFATDVVTTGGSFISEPNGVILSHKAKNSRAFALLIARWDALRPTETWAADALTAGAEGVEGTATE